MYICVKCKREMQCIKNGVGADYGHGHVYPGDLYKCGVCGFELLSTVGNPTSDIKYEIQDLYIRVKDGGVAPVDERERLLVLQRIDRDFQNEKS